MENIYQHVKNMDENQFKEFLYQIYWKANKDGAKYEDDSIWIRDIFPYIDAEQWDSFTESCEEFDNFAWKYNSDDFDYYFFNVVYKGSK